MGGVSVGNGERPLRVLQVASGMPNWGGAELHLVSLAAELRRRGHEATVLCRPQSFVAKEAARRGLPIVHGLVYSQSDFGAYGRLLPALRAGRYDVLHVHMFPDHIVPPLAARAAGVPVAVMTHHLPFPLKKSFWKRFLIRRVLFHRAIGVSESVRRLLIESGMTAERVETIHHGTDVRAFRALTRGRDEVRAEWGCGPEHVLIGIVGRLTREKGIDVFIEAIAALNEERVRGIILGSGERASELERMVQENGLGERIRFAGFREDVNNAMNALDVHVLASTWAEPCAAVVQQAMALGKPVIGTDIGGTPEMIVDGETGFLVPPGDAEALAGALQRLLADPDGALRMGAAGQQRCERLFTLERMVDKIEVLYRMELERVRRQ